MADNATAKNFIGHTLAPATVKLKSTLIAAQSISAETLITLNASTTFVRIITGSYGVFIKWATGVAASTDNFDDFCPADSIVDLLRPDSVTTIAILAETAVSRVMVIEK